MSGSDRRRKDRTLSTGYRPFEELKSLLEKESFSVPRGREPIESIERIKPIETVPKEIFKEASTDEELFRMAMADVTPLCRKNCTEIEHRVLPERARVPRIEPNIDPNIDRESLERLTKLVEQGHGFVVAQTPEYIEDARYCDNPEIAKRLHRGDFSIQAHIDLHGMWVERAEEAVDRFLKESIYTGKRAVLIVHGRGLSSPAKPVLKNKVQEWLSYGPWRKWVIAYSSARKCDGGAGATYVLLRRQPFTKRQRRKKRGGLKG